MELLLAFTVIFVALVFTYTNGFHDTANAIATVVGTKVLTPRQAILLAAVTNLFGAFFGLAVAKTISSGLVEAKFITQEVLICALLSAIAWNLLTWWFGLPSSSSHALIGSLVGAAIASAHGNWEAVKWNEVKSKPIKMLVEPTPEVASMISTNTLEPGTTFLHVGTNKIAIVSFGGRVKMVAEKPGVDRSGVLHKVLIPMVTSPILGFLGGLVVMLLLYLILRGWKPSTVNRVFGKLQLASSAYMGFSHGMNDATKCMGIITLALVTGTKKGLFEGPNFPNWLNFLRTPEGSNIHALSLGDRLESFLPSVLQFGYMPGVADPKSQAVPDWVVVLCALTMALGTAAGGWRIIKTLGHKMVKLQPVHGFAAETTAATVLAVAGSLGMPVSTTHAITTSIMGVGCAKRFSALKLKVIERIVWAWVLTIPAAATVAYLLVQLGRMVNFVKD